MVGKLLLSPERSARRSSSMRAAAVLTLLLVSSSAGAADPSRPDPGNQNARAIPARLVRAPASVSPALRRKIAEPIEQTMKDLRLLTPRTPAEWRQRIGDINRYVT